MSEEFSQVWQFGEFRLDVCRKVLRHRDRTIAMPLKELQVLSLLVRNPGELVTKEELIEEIWGDSFVEESNLTRHIYLLRRSLKALGADGLIENVPRRGYKFVGEAQALNEQEIVLEKHRRTRTLIEFQDDAPRPSIGRPLFIYAASALAIVCAVAFFGDSFLEPRKAERKIASIAVLPFKGLPGASDTDLHMRAGLSDVLITRLSRIKDLKVRPADSIAGLETVDPLDTGRRLGVDAVLDGSVYSTGDRLRVTARLIDVRDSTVMWSGEFDKVLADQLTIHTEIAQQIVPMIAINLSPAEWEETAGRFTASADAYELYIRGRHEWNKRTAPGMVEAQRLFRNAVEADPNFVLAYVGLADTLLTDPKYQVEAQAVITRALSLDPSLAEAHASHGFYQTFYIWDWEGAEAAFKRAIELNPNYATAHHWYATLLAIRGDLDGARREMETALALNPTSHNFVADLGLVHFFAGDYARAESYCRKALELAPDFAFAHEYLHYIYLKTGRFEEAVAEIAISDEINLRLAFDSTTRRDLRHSYGEAFQRSGIKGYLDHKYPANPTVPEAFYNYAIKHALTGENEKALDYLERSANARMFLVVFARSNPLFDGLRSEKRYQDLIRKMGLA